MPFYFFLQGGGYDNLLHHVGREAFLRREQPGDHRQHPGQLAQGLLPAELGDQQPGHRHASHAARGQTRVHRYPQVRAT